MFDKSAFFNWDVHIFDRTYKDLVAHSVLHSFEKCFMTKQCIGSLIHLIVSIAFYIYVQKSLPVNFFPSSVKTSSKFDKISIGFQKLYSVTGPLQTPSYSNHTKQTKNK